jgi:hypothetical protein
MLALVPAAPASADGRRAHVFEPAKTSNHAVTFHVRGVNARNVLRASLVRGGHARRHLGRDRARRIARRGNLRVAVRTGHRRMARIVSHASARRATLWVRRRARGSVRLKVVTETEPPDTPVTADPETTTDSQEETVDSPEREPTATQEEEQAPVGDALLFDSFTGEDGVITNHYAFWSDDDSAFRDDVWEMESGCAFRDDNTLWTGVPTSNLPNRDCSNGSGSEVFRLWTKRSFTDVNVTFSLRNNGYVSGAEGERSWDGIKIWLRRQGGSGSVGLYTAEVNRRQGNIMIQKKCAGSDEYHILSQARPEGSEASIGEWEKVGGSIKNEADGSVKITLMRHGQTVLEATDDGVGCAPYTTAGRVGIRGDYTNFNADDFLVVPAV